MASVTDSTAAAAEEEDSIPPLDNVWEGPGIAFFGDGATIGTIPMINVLGAGVYNPAILGTIDCTGHIASGGIKDAPFIASLFMPFIDIINARAGTDVVDCVFFDGVPVMCRMLVKFSKSITLVSQLGMVPSMWLLSSSAMFSLRSLRSRFWTNLPRSAATSFHRVDMHQQQYLRNIPRCTMAESY